MGRHIVTAGALSLLLSVPLNGAKAPASAVPAHPDDKTIVHVLNRIGFGARPGDVDVVRRMGLQAYIGEQLHPERLADTDAMSRVAGFETLGKSPRDLAEEYFEPAMRARREARRPLRARWTASRC